MRTRKKRFDLDKAHFFLRHGYWWKIDTDGEVYIMEWTPWTGLRCEDVRKELKAGLIHLPRRG